MGTGIDFNKLVIPPLLRIHDHKLTSSVRSFRNSLRRLESNPTSPNGLVAYLSQSMRKFVDVYRRLITEPLDPEKATCLRELYLFLEGVYYPAWKQYFSTYVVSRSGVEQSP